MWIVADERASEIVYRIIVLKDNTSIFGLNQDFHYENCDLKLGFRADLGPKIRELLPARLSGTKFQVSVFIVKVLV